MQNELFKLNGSGLIGAIKIWKTDKSNGESVLVADKPNLVTREGASLAAAALSGLPNSKITHMYVAYFAPATSPTLPTPAKSDTVASYASLISDPVFGYARIPLSTSPDFFSDTGYTDNNVLFTTVLSSDVPTFGAAFEDEVTVYEAGLISARNTNPADDRLFSRATFNPIVYDESFNLTVAWAIKFTA
jgi:hypothetical protein